jgi:hypothetical protein
MSHIIEVCRQVLQQAQAAHSGCEMALKVAEKQYWNANKTVAKKILTTTI